MLRSKKRPGSCARKSMQLEAELKIAQGQLNVARKGQRLRQRPAAGNELEAGESSEGARQRRKTRRKMFASQLAKAQESSRKFRRRGNGDAKAQEALARRNRAIEEGAQPSAETRSRLPRKRRRTAAEREIGRRRTRRSQASHRNATTAVANWKGSKDARASRFARSLAENSDLNRSSRLPKRLCAKSAKTSRRKSKNWPT